MYLKNKENNFVLKDIKCASSFFDRGVGLMFSKNMGKKNALVIDPCKSIHTMFMRFSIDVLFVSKCGKIEKIIKGMRPWRFSSLVWKSSYVIEMESSKFISNFKVGDEVEIND